MGDFFFFKYIEFLAWKVTPDTYWTLMSILHIHVINEERSPNTVYIFEINSGSCLPITNAPKFQHWSCSQIVLQNLVDMNKVYPYILPRKQSPND